MASSNEKLASALEELRELQSDGSRVFASAQLGRTTRERLVGQGFLAEVMKGWLVSTNPTAGDGDTTPWFSSFWEFCRRYCEDRFGEHWSLSPEDSLLLSAERTAIPHQVIVGSPGANNKPVVLAHGTSLFALRTTLPPATDRVVRDGLRMYSVDAALVRVTEAFFRAHAVEAQIVLQGITDPSALLSRLLDDGRTIVAGRLAGAFRRIGRVAIANEIIATMKSAGHATREQDPFDADDVVEAAPVVRTPPPFVARLQALWRSTRSAVLDADFPAAKRRTNVKAELSSIDEVYKVDAYHSLSIEGYVVTTELVERVAAGAWDPDNDAADRENKNALAARGYWLAFQAVRDVIADLLVGGDVSQLRSAHREWYRSLFAPNVAVGLIKASALAGYRTEPVFLRGSRHVPPRAALIRDAVPALFDLIEEEDSPPVRAVLGHWLLGYIHPFPDGNGRVARFVMNALLVHAGHPWTIIRVEDRTDYLAALEAASVNLDLRPFARFVAAQMRRSATLPARRPTRRRTGR